MMQKDTKALVSRSGRIGALHRILDYMLTHKDIWICRRDDIATHWAQHHTDPRV
jgi:allantoinase